jgi:hypothetical protein
MIYTRFAVGGQPAILIATFENQYRTLWSLILSIQLNIYPINDWNLLISEEEKSFRISEEFPL